MKINSQALYKAIKNKWQRANPGKKMVCDGDKQFYFKDLKDNLICDMSPQVVKAYSDGAGNELKKKMRALHSSSAMTFNIFGNSKVKIKRNKFGLPPGIYSVEYEKQLTALNPERKAHLDVLLTSEEEIILFEMKMTEWLLSDPSTLPVSYLNREDKYPDAELAKTLINLERRYLGQLSEADKKYRCKNACFDVFQMIKHIFGIYNGRLCTKELPALKKVTLAAGIWTITEPDFFAGTSEDFNHYKLIEKQMSEEITDFKNSLDGVKDLFASEGIDFNFVDLSVEEILSCLSKNKNEKFFLERYI